MHFAQHVIDQKDEFIGISPTKERINLLRRLAAKKVYICPYCKVPMIIRSGKNRGTYFAHPKNLTCLESEQVEKSYKRYQGQKKRESLRHPMLVSLIKDELKTANKDNDRIFIAEGYLISYLYKYFPDLYIRIGDVEWAITVVTNLSDVEDQQLASTFAKRQKYFLENGMQHLWLIDRGNLAVEEEKRGIVLWETEWLGSLKTLEDEKWAKSVLSYTTKDELFDIFGYPSSELNMELSVRSIYYVSLEEDTNRFRVMRYVDDRVVRPFRGFLIGETYSISISQALQINFNSFQLGDAIKEERLRQEMKISFFKEKETKIKRIKEEQLLTEKREMQHGEEVNRMLNIREEQFHRKKVEQKEDNYSRYVHSTRPKSSLTSEELENKRESVRRANFIGTEEEYQKLKRNLELYGRTWTNS